MFNFCVVKIKKNKKIPVRSLTRVFSSLVACGFSNIFIIFSVSETMAELSFSAFFIFLEIGAFLLLFYSFDIADIKISRKKIACFFSVLIFIDIISFAVNIFTNHYFSVYQTTFFGESFYHFSGTKWYVIHLSLVYSMMLFCALSLVRTAIKVPPVYKAKYIVSIAIIILVALLNGISKIIQSPIDFSIYFYGLMGFSFYYVPYFYIPENVIRKSFGFFVNSMESGLILFDTANNCIFVNKMIESVFNVSKDTVCSCGVLRKYLCGRCDKTASQIDFSKAEEYSSHFDYAVGPLVKNFKLSFHKIFDSKRNYIGYYFTILDVTEEITRIKNEHNLAVRDKLTGLYNRDYFCEQVTQRLSKNDGTKYCIVVSDIVNFKLINDLFGTDFGDIILKRIANELRKLAVPGEIYGRLHNDHFVIFMPRDSFNEKLLLEEFSKTFEFLNKFAYSLVCHVGIYDVTDLSLPVSVMCDRAFLALSKIHSNYTQRFAFYSDALRSEVVKIQELMNELPLALKAGELEMYLQPQISNSGKLLGAEALVRWNHKKKGFISPSDFIQTIEQISMISDVDIFVWEAACKKLAEWKAKGMDDMYISVNISPKDFYIVDVYKIFTSLVKKYDVNPKNLNLEITETAIIQDFESNMRVIRKLRDAGFAVEIDDFGSGYSSLNMLKDVDVDVLKIDMAFLRKSQDDEKSRKILAKIIYLAKELGLTVVTEGVETAEQVKFLTDIGCDIFQGFFFSRPITALEFEEKYFKKDL